MTNITITINTTADAGVIVREYSPALRVHSASLATGQAHFDLTAGALAIATVFLAGPGGTKAPWKVLDGQTVLRERPNAKIPTGAQRASSTTEFMVP